ncbi:MAG: acyl-CoA dehydrogenase family protein [Blastomonas sp.]
MDLDFTEEQDLLRETTRRICESCFDSSVVRALETDDHKLSRDFWSALGDNGLCALRIGEGHGGAAMGTLDMAVVCEEFGYALATSPYLQSAIHSAGILAATGGVLADNWLPRIATGEAIIVPAWRQADIADDGETVSLFGDGRLSGAISLVPFASSAHGFLVEIPSGWALVEAESPGITIAAQKNHASQPLFQIRFDEVQVAPANILATEMPVTGQDVFAEVLIAVAAEAVGSATKLLAMTADYANQRKQFGKPIAAFQAISHPLAECATELEGARYLAYQAAWARDNALPALHLARMAKIMATTLYRRLATLSVQVHGGIGYTIEGEPQLYYRRSKYQELMYDTSSALRAAVADHVLA